MTINNRTHLLIPALALLFQVVPPLLLGWIAASTYLEPFRLSESWEHPLSLLTLVLSTVISFGLGSLGIYRLLMRAHVGIATLLIIFCCMPALLGGALYLHGLLIFLAAV